MEILKHNNQNVYTHSVNRVTTDELKRANAGIGTIVDAYFFKIGPDRTVERTKFDRKEIEKEKTGLMVDVKGAFGQSSVAIAGLDRITKFLYDTNILGQDLLTLKGREVTEYNRGINGGMQLIGIGINN